MIAPRLIKINAILHKMYLCRIKKTSSSLSSGTANLTIETWIQLSELEKINIDKNIISFMAQSLKKK